MGGIERRQPVQHESVKIKGILPTPQSHRSWIAIQVRPRCERLVALLLHNKGYEEFLPTYDNGAKQRGTAKPLELPLFPGYLFCRINPDSLGGLIVTTPGVIRILGVPGKPSVVPDEEILALQRIVSSGVERTPVFFPGVGQKIRILDGPLVGLIGTYLEVVGSRRVIIPVEIFSRAVAITVDKATVDLVD